MKLVTFLLDGQERIGADVEGAAGRMVDLHRAYAAYLRDVEKNLSADPLAAAVLGRDMVEFLKRGEKAVDAARKALAHAENNPARRLYRRPPTGATHGARTTARRAGVGGQKLFRSRVGNGVEKRSEQSSGILEAARNV